MVSMRDLMAWAALRLRHGTGDHEDDPVDTAELVATINRMRTGARAGLAAASTAPRRRHVRDRAS